MKNIEDEIDDSRKQFVMEMDLQCEAAIKKILRKAFPDYGLLTEEDKPEGLSHEEVWVIDPIDGTLSYSRGMDSYVIAIALIHRNQVVLSAVYQPEKDELFFAEQEKVTYLNGERLRVATEKDLSKSIVSIGHHTLRVEDYPKIKYSLIKEIRRLRVSESCSQELCYLAAGKIDAFVRTLQPTYDYAMGKIIVEEAGGILSDFKGNSLQVQLNTKRNTNIIVGNQELAKELLKYVN